MIFKYDESFNFKAKHSSRDFAFTSIIFHAFRSISEIKIGKVLLLERSLRV